MLDIWKKHWMHLLQVMVVICMFGAKAETNIDYRVMDAGYAQFEYIVTEEGYARIRGCISIESDCEELALPSVIDGHPVIALDSLYGSNDPLPCKRLIIPDSYVEITRHGFYGAWDLESVSLPSSLGMIEGNPFSGEDYSMMQQLKEIQVSPLNKAFKVENGCLVDIAKQKLIAATNSDHSELPKVRIIGEAAFQDNQQLKRILIPDTVEIIEESAFADCINLREVTLSGRLRQIGPMAFCGCAALTEIAIPDTVRDIGSSAFACCAMLEKVSLSQGLKEINLDAFDRCEHLSTIHIPEGVERIRFGLFGVGATGVQEIYIPTTVAEIGIEAVDSWREVLVKVKPLSYAEKFCMENGLRYKCY